MAYIFLLLLGAILSPAQTVQFLSPSGSKPNLAIQCPECAAVNRTDGFALEPLIQVRFSAPVNPATLRQGVFLIWLDTQQTVGFTTYPQRYLMPVNQVGWDPATNTMYAKPDEALDHDRNYALVVSSAVKDMAGRSITRGSSYLPGPEEAAEVIATTRFHTRNVTGRILSRRLGPAASLRRVLDRTIDLSGVKSIKVLSQTLADPAAPLTDEGFPADITFLTQLGLRRLVFLRYESSRGDMVDVHAWLPTGPAPASGWPVMLIGHGFFDQRFSGPTLFASAFIANSVVMSIDAVGHGFGPASQLRFEFINGTAIDVPTAGRGRDLDGNGIIENAEGCVLLSPDNLDFISTCLRETALDYQKLVREIQAGIDLDGDGMPDLDSNRIQYLGQSLGAMYGTILMAIEPGIDAAVLNVGGGSAIETSRYSTVLRPLFQQFIASLYPQFSDLPDPLIQRYQPVQILANPRSGPYLEALDRLAILEADGAPASFAPFLKQATLYGIPIKRVLFQYAQGDQFVPNPSNGQLIRAAFEYDLVSLYRHDLARAAAPTLPGNPHGFMAAFAQLDTPSLLIALATLTQASQFLASGKNEVPDVNALVRFYFRQNLFETPMLLP